MYFSNPFPPCISIDPPVAIAARFVNFIEEISEELDDDSFDIIRKKAIWKNFKCALNQFLNCSGNNELLRSINPHLDQLFSDQLKLNAIHWMEIISKYTIKTAPTDTDILKRFKKEITDDTEAKKIFQALISVKLDTSLESNLKKAALCLEIDDKQRAIELIKDLLDVTSRQYVGKDSDRIIIFLHKHYLEWIKIDDSLRTVCIQAGIAGIMPFL